MLFWCVSSQFRLSALLLWFVVRKLQHSVCVSTALVWKQAEVRLLYLSLCSYATECCRHDCLCSWCVSICLHDSLIVTPSACLFAFHLFSISISFRPLVPSHQLRSVLVGKSRKHSFQYFFCFVYFLLILNIHYAQVEDSGKNSQLFTALAFILFQTYRTGFLVWN